MNTNNKLIAEFIGFEEEDGIWVAPNPYIDQLYELSDLRFHISWDWLMPVVEKINELGYRVQIYYRSTLILNTDETIINSPYGYSLNITMIEQTYKAVIEFIKWYNNE